MSKIAELSERRSYVERAVADAVQAERARIAAFVNDLAVGQGLAVQLFASNVLEKLTKRG